MHNMRIAYMVHLNMGPDSGVFKKIISQINVWLQYSDVKIFIITRCLDESIKKYYNFDSAIYTYQNRSIAYRSRITAFERAVNDIIAWNPDVIYTRQDHYYPPVKQLAINNALVIEVNTNFMKEVRMYSRLKWLYSLASSRIILSKAAGLVFVCSELAQEYQYRKYNKPYTLIGNGFPIEEVKTLPPNNTDTVRLVFIGQAGCSWHGVDKIIRLANLCPGWEFELIGISQSEIDGSAPTNLHLHGKLNRSQYEQILQISDCAIGTLALHRNGMKEASPLKVREYLAYGLPVIIAYEDTDFPNGASFLLKLPNCEDNIDNNIQLIQNFVNQWKGKRVPRNEVMHLSTWQKESKRLDFFRQVINRRNCSETNRD
ncbi:hypothetical protein [Acetomicrobium hydrogeniformans]|nr:hypothetical protein [Acetomicrobium hydrogeniformans]